MVPFVAAAFMLFCFFQAEDGIRDLTVTGVQTCALPISLALGLVWWLAVLYQWFGDAIAESEGGQYGRKIDLSFRWSMSWFIFSEVMFFGAFFTALWWARSHSVPALGSLENALLWPDFKAVWPSLAAGVTASPT